MGRENTVFLSLSILMAHLLPQYAVAESLWVLSHATLSTSFIYMIVSITTSSEHSHSNTYCDLEGAGVSCAAGPSPHTIQSLEPAPVGSQGWDWQTAVLSAPVPTLYWSWWGLLIWSLWSSIMIAEHVLLRSGDTPLRKILTLPLCDDT